MNIAGIKDLLALLFNENTRGTQDVARIKEGDFSSTSSQWIHRKGFLILTHHPAILEVIDFTVVIEWIFRNAQLIPLTCHNVDRIVKKRISKGGAGSSQINRRRGMIPLGDWQGADVVEM